MSTSPSLSPSPTPSTTTTTTVRSPTLSPPPPSPASTSSVPSPSNAATSTSLSPTSATPLAHPSTFHEIPYTSLTTPERTLITTHARTVRLTTGTRPSPTALATWFAQHHSGRLPAASAITRLTASKPRKRISAELKSLAWGFIVDEVLRSGKRPELGEVVAWLAAREGRRRRKVVVKRAMEGWERGVMEGVEGLSDSGGEGEEALLGGLEGGVVVPVGGEMRGLVEERRRAVVEGVLRGVEEGLEVWCRGAAGMGMSVCERALKMKARVLLAEVDKDMKFPPGWITQWRMKHGIRTADDISNMPPPALPGPAATAPTPAVSTVTAAALEAETPNAAVETDTAAAALEDTATPASIGLSFPQAPELYSDVDESYRVYLDLIPEQFRGEKKPLIPGDRDLPIYLD